MSLWAIARSPLMHGGDMTRMDDFTLSLLTNREVLQVNQDSRDNRPLFERDGLIAWVATAPHGEDKYLALFNARDPRPLLEHEAVFTAELRGGADALSTQLIDVPVVAGSRLMLVADDGHGGNGGHHAVVWGEPVLSGPSGDLSLTELDWVHATSRWGSVLKNQTGSGGKLVLGGRPLDRGLGVHIKSVIVFEVPAGYTRFVAECGFEGHGALRAPASRARCLVFHQAPVSVPQPAGLPITVTARELGWEGSISVRDLWQGRELGSFEQAFTQVVPWHGAALLRISPRPSRAQPLDAG
jgi:hypothetical protein